MPAEPEALLSCEACGATIYPEHLEKHRAERLEGKLLCPHCLIERRGQREPVARPLADGADLPVAAIQPDGAARPAPPRIQHNPGLSAGRKEQTFRRPLLKHSSHATRCKSFHCRIGDASLQNMNDMINEWLDSQPEIEIKFALNQVGAYEGKGAEQHLVITVFY